MSSLSCICTRSPPTPIHSTVIKDTLLTGLVLSSHEVEVRNVVPFASNPSPFPRWCLWPLKASNYRFQNTGSKVPCSPLTGSRRWVEPWQVLTPELEEASAYGKVSMDTESNWAKA